MSSIDATINEADAGRRVLIFSVVKVTNAMEEGGGNEKILPMWAADVHMYVKVAAFVFLNNILIQKKMLSTQCEMTQELSILFDSNSVE